MCLPICKMLAPVSSAEDLSRKIYRSSVGGSDMLNSVVKKEIILVRENAILIVS